MPLIFVYLFFLWSVSPAAAGTAASSKSAPATTKPLPGATPSSSDGVLLNGPSGIAIDHVRGRLYVADTGNNRILWWDASVPLTNDRPADGVLGQHDLSSTAVNRSTSVAADTLHHPSGLCVDSQGNLWVADTGNNRVLKFAVPVTSGMAATIVIGHKDFTSHIANTPDDRKTKKLTVLGDQTFGKPLANTLFSPSSVFVDRTGIVWVADTNNNRVLAFRNPRKNGVPAYRVLGQNDLTSNVSDLTGTGGWSSFSERSRKTGPHTLSLPAGIFVDPRGNVWVADRSNNRVMMYRRSPGNGAKAAVVLGQTDYRVNAGNRGEEPNADTLRGPSSVWMDREGSMWVADTDNHRIVRFGKDAETGQPANGIVGQKDFMQDLPNAGGTADMTTMCGPAGAVMDSSGNLWVVDSGNNRILRFPPPFYAADLAAGQTGPSPPLPSPRR